MEEQSNSDLLTQLLHDFADMRQQVEDLLHHMQRVEQRMQKTYQEIELFAAEETYRGLQQQHPAMLIEVSSAPHRYTIGEIPPLDTCWLQEEDVKQWKKATYAEYSEEENDIW